MPKQAGDVLEEHTYLSHRLLTRLFWRMISIPVAPATYAS
jgi:hypothetical protein